MEEISNCLPMLSCRVTPIRIVAPTGKAGRLFGVLTTRSDNDLRVIEATGFTLKKKKITNFKKHNYKNTKITRSESKAFDSLQFLL